MSLKAFYKGKRVLVTGHTGFKGSWLVQWLDKMDSEICAISLEPAEDNHFERLNLDIESHYLNINDAQKIDEVISAFKPEIVFHLAAQALVQYSYKNPVETYQTNVIGTMNVYEACRRVGSVKSIVSITTDKCYENMEWEWGYRENDRLGGHDPYSSSKACTEIMTSSYIRSFFNLDNYGKDHNTLITTVRAGNVIGGGDWAENRIIPDIVRATVKNEAVEIRNPSAVRPWQHVLEPLLGYLKLGALLYEGKKEFATSWNFGPSADSTLTVLELTEIFQKYWEDVRFNLHKSNEFRHEANLLMLDCSKARKFLKWGEMLGAEKTIEWTVEWYKEFYKNGKIITHHQIDEFMSQYGIS
ncbi:CDP-glucose 4,6-dehydratase [Halobacteriovorax sp. GB3]|uniref:CDP-glucose 4,6-dehydratase n=1 Tax=Halobacteriovorax sp. GB3 TaxID=2719615 RepID=UPI00235F64BD|nr:CDP-glucose 4,6-dehydratase [Halobacteriovorax sp. GB3]MDD0852536.1 CDP-glucose 4,6-dehydratase [Halobacteriovorax sp. GB3]